MSKSAQVRTILASKPLNTREVSELLNWPMKYTTRELYNRLNQDHVRIAGYCGGGRGRTNNRVAIWALTEKGRL